MTKEAEFADSRLDWRRLLAEAAGTFPLVLTAAGGGTVDAVSGGAAGRTAAVVAPGLMVLALIYTIGETSGAHLNNAGHNAAIAVGGYVALAGLWASPVSGASVNPARSLG